MGIKLNETSKKHKKLKKCCGHVPLYPKSVIRSVYLNDNILPNSEYFNHIAILVNAL